MREARGPKPRPHGLASLRLACGIGPRAGAVDADGLRPSAYALLEPGCRGLRLKAECLRPMGKEARARG
eukprot:9500295-Pyramimonas_sp.AAC.1